MRRSSNVLPRELRLRILELVDNGDEVVSISRHLSVPVAAVHRAIAWRQHVQSHQRISKRFRERLGIDPGGSIRA